MFQTLICLTWYQTTRSIRVVLPPPLPLPRRPPSPCRLRQPWRRNRRSWRPLRSPGPVRPHRDRTRQHPDRRSPVMRRFLVMQPWRRTPMIQRSHLRTVRRRRLQALVVPPSRCPTAGRIQRRTSLRRRRTSRRRRMLRPTRCPMSCRMARPTLLLCRTSRRCSPTAYLLRRPTVITNTTVRLRRPMR